MIPTPKIAYKGIVTSLFDLIGVPLPSIATNANGYVIGLNGPNGIIPLATTIGKTGVPAGIPSSGTIAANGNLTLVTALQLVYSGIWLYFPAGAVSGGAAGLYWCVMASTTVGLVTTIFSDTSTGFIPYVPTVAAPAAVGSGVAYTQVTGVDVTITSGTVPGNMLGISGSVRVDASVAMTATATGKVLKLFFGGALMWSAAPASLSNSRILIGASNRGLLSSQISKTPTNGTGYGSANLFRTAAIDTTQPQTLLLTANLAAATDYLVYESSEGEVTP